MRTLLLLTFVFCLSISMFAQSPYPTGGLQSGGYASGGDEKPAYAFIVGERWNMVSVPLSISNYAAVAAFPLASSQAFAYEGTYVTKDTLKNGTGYWLKFNSAQGIVMEGAPISRETIDVVDGWNMIGSLSPPIPTSSIFGIGTTILSECFGYAGSYQSAQTINPGSGYWVKVGSAGKLVLSSEGITPKSIAKATGANFLGHFNKLIIETKNGLRGTLYFDRKPDGNFRQELYQLPPLGPAGVPDARFASQSMVEVYEMPLEKPVEFPLNLYSAAYPVTVSWELAKENREKFILTDNESGALLGSVALAAGGKLTITDSTVTTLILRIQAGKQIPTEYALRQSYPNPFNPTATIEFDLPKDAKVTLKIYDILGREVLTLKDNEQIEAGTHKVQFTASNFASGAYFYRISARGEGKTFADVKKLLFVK